jgi:hypothetical protein
VEQDAAGARYGRLSIEAADVWCVADDVERRSQLLEKQVW